MNCPANFIMISAAATDRIAARVSGSPALQHSRYLSKAPVRAQPVIISTVFTGFERALLCGSENSVNATRSGEQYRTALRNVSAGTPELQLLLLLL